MSWLRFSRQLGSCGFVSVVSCSGSLSGLCGSSSGTLFGSGNHCDACENTFCHPGLMNTFNKEVSHDGSDPSDVRVAHP